jgi:hypothetical protein
VEVTRIPWKWLVELQRGTAKRMMRVWEKRNAHARLKAILRIFLRKLATYKTELTSVPRWNGGKSETLKVENIVSVTDYERTRPETFTPHECTPDIS